GFMLCEFYRCELRGKRMLLADNMQNTDQTFAHCAELIADTGGSIIASVEIYDRGEAIADLSVPNIALAEYQAPENYEAAACPLCKASVPITRFRSGGTCNGKQP